MTVYTHYVAPNGHDWKFYALPQTFAPIIDYIAEHMGSGERIIESVDSAAPDEFHERALADLARMVDAWRPGEAEE